MRAGQQDAPELPDITMRLAKAYFVPRVLGVSRSGKVAFLHIISKLRLSANVSRYATAAVAKRRRLWRRPYCISKIQLRNLGAQAARSAATRMYQLLAGRRLPSHIHTTHNISRAARRAAGRLWYLTALHLPLRNSLQSHFGGR